MTFVGIFEDSVSEELLKYTKSGPLVRVPKDVLQLMMMMMMIYLPVLPYTMCSKMQSKGYTNMYIARQQGGGLEGTKR